jgi:hypothetical protein
MAAIPKSAVWLTTNQLCKNLLGDPHSMRTRALSGLLSGLPEALVIGPAELVKIKLQSRRFKGKERESEYNLI